MSGQRGKYPFPADPLDYPPGHAFSGRSSRSNVPRPGHHREPRSVYGTTQFSNTPIPHTNPHARTRSGRSSPVRHYEHVGDRPNTLKSCLGPLRSNPPDSHPRRSLNSYTSTYSRISFGSGPSRTPLEAPSWRPPPGVESSPPIIISGVDSLPMPDHSRSLARPLSGAPPQSRRSSASSQRLRNNSERSLSSSSSSDYEPSFQSRRSTASVQIVDGSPTLRSQESGDTAHFARPVSQHSVISSTMPIQDVISLLVYHECPDITQDLDLDNCDSTPHSHGGFGDVYQGFLFDGTKVALKCLRSYVVETKDNEKALKRAARELHTWSQCQHQNVVELYGLVIFQGKLAMVSPWIKGVPENRRRT